MSPGTPESDPQAGTKVGGGDTGGTAELSLRAGGGMEPPLRGTRPWGRPGAAAAALPPSPGAYEAEGSRRPFPSSLPLCHLRHWHSRQKRAWALTSSVLREGDTGICFLPLQLHGEAKLLF